MTHYTPTNPSAVATRRVESPVPAPTECPYCKQPVYVVHASEIFPPASAARFTYPWLYSCRQCHARIGMHPDTAIPLGVMANGELRAKRKLAKSMFHKLVHIGTPDGNEPVFLTRRGAYYWLSISMGIPKTQCHFGFFNMEQCDEAMKIMTEVYGDIVNG